VGNSIPVGGVDGRDKLSQKWSFKIEPLMYGDAGRKIYNNIFYPSIREVLI